MVGLEKDEKFIKAEDVVDYFHLVCADEDEKKYFEEVNELIETPSNIRVLEFSFASTKPNNDCFNDVYGYAVTIHLEEEKDRFDQLELLECIRRIIARRITLIDKKRREIENKFLKYKEERKWEK